MPNSSDIQASQALGQDGLPYSWWTEVGIVTGVWGGYALLRFLQFYVIEETSLHIGVNYLLCSVIFVFITFFVFKLCRFLVVDKFGLFAVVFIHIILLLLVTSSVSLILQYSRIAKSYLVEIEGSYGISDMWGIPYLVVSKFLFVNHVEAYLVVLAAGLGRDFFLRYTSKQTHAHELQQQAQQLQTQLTSARLDALRSQINPHFLFNTLHVINTMAGSNSEGVRRATKRLGGLLRYALSSDEQEVPVSRELQFLRGYLEIQKLRLQDQLRIKIETDADVQNALMPTLLLQPLAENAVKHGVQHVEGTGRIRIRVFRENRVTVVRVEDNGPGVTGKTSGEGSMGLQNIRERLAQLYGSDASLALSDSDLGGCRAEVQLPYHTNEDPHFEAVMEEGGREQVASVAS